MATYELCYGCLEPRSDGDMCTQCGYVYAAQQRGGAMLLPGGTLLHNGQYMIARKLGQGGFGITYLGWDTALARKVAIKEYMPSQIAGRSNLTREISVYDERNTEDFQYGMQRFLDEAQTVAKFQAFPNIIWVYNFFRENGTAYMVMEYLAGETFEAYIARNAQKVPFDASKRIMLPVMDALREVHRRNLLHRDISPDNIFVSPSGPVKVLDFGAARFELSQRSRGFSTILKQGYAPVEQYSSRGNQGPWTDVYAVGCTMYRSLTGMIPPPSIDRREHDTLEPPSKLGVDIPPPAEAALMHALAIEIKDRIQSMQQLQTELLGQQAPISVRPKSEKPPARDSNETVVIRDPAKKLSSSQEIQPVKEETFKEKAAAWLAKLTPFFKTRAGMATAGVAGAAIIALLVILLHGSAPPDPGISRFAAGTPDSSGVTQLSWKVVNATNVTIDGGIGPVAPEGSISVRPAQNTVYTITATAQNGDAVHQSVTVPGTFSANQNRGPSGPAAQTAPLRIAFFGISPQRVMQNGVATLSWGVEGAQSVSITPDVGAAPASGEKELSFSVPGTYTWTIVATDPSGRTAEQQIHLQVLPNEARNNPSYVAPQQPVQRNTPLVPPNLQPQQPQYQQPQQQYQQPQQQYQQPQQPVAPSGPSFRLEVRHDHSGLRGFFDRANGTAGYCYGVLTLSNGTLTYRVQGSTDQREDPFEAPVKDLTSISVGKVLGDYQTIHVAWNGQKYNFIPVGGGLNAEQAVGKLEDAANAP